MNEIEAGARCLARFGGEWAEATIVRVNEDGSFDVTLDGETSILAKWVGVTREELSFDGERHEREASAPTPFYWNQVRMAGRVPSSVSRRVTTNDAMEALALADRADPEAVAVLETHERRLGLTLPEELRVLATREGVRQAFIDGHPNAPNFLAIDEWARVSGPSADYLILVAPHQGEHLWGIELPRDGSPAGRVFVFTIDETESRVEQALYTAESFAFFVWDLAQTGLVWFQSTNYLGGRPFRRTDLGVVPLGLLVFEDDEDDPAG